MDIIDGIFINAGEKALYTKIIGNGIPPIVIEPGWGGLSAEWSGLQYKLSELTTVISYDRAGYGESEKSKRQRTPEQIITELKIMLDNTGIPAPYIFLSHSAACLYTGLFCSKYPDYAAAAIFLEPYSKELDNFDSDEFKFYKENLSIEARMKNLKQYIDMDKEKFNYFISLLTKNLYSHLPESISRQLIAYQSDQQFFQTLVDEYESFVGNAESFDYSNFPDIPLTIIARDPKVMAEVSVQLNAPTDEAEALEKAWSQRVKQLCELSTKSKFIIAENSDHNIHLSAQGLVLTETIELLGNFGSYVEFG